MPTHIATWNGVRGVWETTTSSLLCEHSAPFLATWPGSGSMRSGVTFERPMSERRTAAAASSLSRGLPALPTPRARDHKTGGKDGLDEALGLLGTPRCPDGMKHALRSDVVDPRGRLEDQVAILPTPNAALGRGTGTPSAATAQARFDQGKRYLDDAVALLPTPSATPYGNNQSESPGAAVRPSLDGIVRDLLATPTSSLSLGVQEMERQLADSQHPRSTGESTVPPSGVGRGS